MSSTTQPAGERPSQTPVPGPASTESLLSPPQQTLAISSPAAPTPAGPVGPTLLDTLDYHGNVQRAHVNPVPNGSAYQQSVGNNNGQSSADQEVFTPVWWRMDSRIFFAHTFIHWLTNSIWAFLIWQKLEGRLHSSWWAVFAPTIACHLVYTPMSLVVMLMAEYFVYRQIGPPPPLHASSGLTFAYAVVHHVRVRSHRVDWANNALESVGLLVAKCLFCDALQRGVLASTSLRLIFTPVWVVWPLTLALQCLKGRGECFLGFVRRHLLFIMLVIIACKVDGVVVSSWDVVFMGPFWWCVGMVALACALFGLLITQMCEPFRALRSTLVVEVGLLGVLLAGAVPHLLAIRALQKRVEGTAGVSYKAVLLPIALSWLLMCLMGLVVVVGLRLREVWAARLMALGRVWTADEGLARRLGGPTTGVDWREAQKKVDKMSEEEICRLVESMMAGKTKPGRLRRVGENLYKRATSLDLGSAGEKAEKAAEGALVAGGTADSGTAQTAPATQVTPVSPLDPQPPALVTVESVEAGGAGTGAGPASNISLQSFSSSSVPDRPAGGRGEADAGRPAPVRVGTGAGPGVGGTTGAPASAPPAAVAAGPSQRGGTPGASSGIGGGGSRGLSGLRHNRVVPTTGSPHAAAAASAPAPAAAIVAAGGGGSRGAAGDSGAPTGPTAAAPAAGVAATAAPAAAAAAGADGAAAGSLAGSASRRDRPGSGTGPAEGQAASGGAHKDAGSATGSGRSSRGSGAAEGAGTAAGAGCPPPGPSKQPTPPPTARSPAALQPPEGSGEAGEGQGAGANGSGGGADSGQAGADGNKAGNGGEVRRPGSSGAAEGQGGRENGSGSQPRPDTANGGSGQGAGGNDSQSAGAAGAATAAAAAGASSEICAVESDGPAADAGCATATATAAGGEADAGGGAAGTSASDSCIICYDGDATCVFLECGHGGFCRRCAYLLFVRPPNECPTCRAVIDQVVEIEAPTQVGELAKVK